MRRPGITAKLFLAVLGVTLTAVVLMALAVQVTFRSGFLEYVRERQRERVEILADVLGRYYGEHGDWAGLEDPRRWRVLVREALWRGEYGRERHDEHEEDEGDDEGHHDEQQEEEDGAYREGRIHERHPRPAGGAAVPAHGRGVDGRGAVAGPTLLDGQGRRVAGPPATDGDVAREPITADGRTVGWLAFEPRQRLTDRLALRFQHDQRMASLVIALVVAVLAAAVSLALARGFLAPLRRLIDGTRALAAGRFDTRVEMPRRDEIGQLGRDFNRLAETLERNERLRRAFMADASHELRTPLSVLRGELEAVQDGVRPLDGETIASLQRNLATLSKLVDDLYELSLADAGALNYRLAPLALGERVEACAEHWRTRIEAAGLRLTVTRPAQEITIDGDRARLEQLLANLLENSLRYTDAGGEIRVAVTREQEEAVITLEDSPPGVPEAALDRVFERLYRVEGSRSRASGGAGLGLAICRNIVEAHGGRIHAYAAPAGGLGVAIRLPVGHRRGGRDGA